MSECIETHRLVLEPLMPSHAAKLFSHLQDDALYTFIPQDPPVSVDVLTERYRRLATRQSDDGEEVWLNYAIYQPSVHDYVGTLQVTILKTKQAIIAYEVFPQRWRQGIAKEGCKALIKHLVYNFNVEIISAYVDTRNLSSWHLLESLGFKRMKKIEKADFFKGSNSDEYLYILDLKDFTH